VKGGQPRAAAMQKVEARPTAAIAETDPSTQLAAAGRRVRPAANKLLRLLRD
jgi:hypothetical protein